KATVYGREREWASAGVHLGGPRRELRLYAGIQALAHRRELDARARHYLARTHQSVHLVQSASGAELLSRPGASGSISLRVASSHTCFGVAGRASRPALLRSTIGGIFGTFRGARGFPRGRGKRHAEARALPISTLVFGFKTILGKFSGLCLHSF